MNTFIYGEQSDMSYTNSVKHNKKFNTIHVLFVRVVISFCLFCLSSLMSKPLEVQYTKG